MSINFFTDENFIEPQARNQIYSLSKLPILAGPLAIMPDCHFGKGATVGSVIPTRGAIVPASVGVDLSCFRGDTKIPLLDGTQATLEELEKRTEKFYVYSVDENKRVVPGLARCIKTKKNARLMRVVVSGGDEIFCTPDHEFMLYDGTYRQAKDLKMNDSLMPLYRRWQTRDGYESVNTGRGSANETHTLVWESLNGKVPKNHVIHHKNHNHFDNRPENLELMTSEQHSSYHRRVGKKFLRNSDPEFQKKRRAGILKRMENPEVLAKMKNTMRENSLTFMREHPSEFAESVKDNGKRGAPYLVKFNTSPRTCENCGMVLKNPASLLWHKKREHAYNHKVQSIKLLDEHTDVYCLEVEKYHNFALSAGVFVHNCGMIAQPLNLTASDLPDSLHEIRLQIEESVPVGFSKDVIKGNHWLGHTKWLEENAKHLGAVSRIEWGKVWNQLGSLGGGNHFIELSLDESNRVWLMLHSGSRNVGKTVAEYYINKAKEQASQRHDSLPDWDLAWLDDSTPEFQEYAFALEWTGKYASENRRRMLVTILNILSRYFGRNVESNSGIINVHHNYIVKEGDIWITRKGAISAKEGEMGIIPGSMGSKSYIVRGKGNPDSYCSCSHGAGRRMSRGEARRRFTETDLLAQTDGVECRKDTGIIDEIPGAYKDIDVVIEESKSLVDVVHTLKAVLCVKG